MKTLEQLITYIRAQPRGADITLNQEDSKILQTLPNFRNVPMADDEENGLDVNVGYVAGHRIFLYPVVSPGEVSPEDSYSLMVHGIINKTNG